jgi:hypothetical protein
MANKSAYKSYEYSSEVGFEKHINYQMLFRIYINIIQIRTVGNFFLLKKDVLDLII